METSRRQTLSTPECNDIEGEHVQIHNKFDVEPRAVNDSKNPTVVLAHAAEQAKRTIILIVLIAGVLVQISKGSHHTPEKSIGFNPGTSAVCGPVWRSQRETKELKYDKNQNSSYSPKR